MDMTVTALPVQAAAPTVAAAVTAPVVRQGARFALIGSAGTVLQLLVYVGLTDTLGVTLAGVASWVLSTLATNLAHRVFTFGVRSKNNAASDLTVAFVTCLIGLGLTTLVTTATASLSVLTALIALVGANVVAGSARFVFLRWWLARRTV